MANFLTQAGSDFWDILRKKLPESFGREWAIPDVPEMAKPVNIAREAINAYSSLPTASHEDISKQVQRRADIGGLSPESRPFFKNPNAPPPTSAVVTRPGDIVPNAAQAPAPIVASSGIPMINETTANRVFTQPVNPSAIQARSVVGTPNVATLGQIPSIEDTVSRFAANNPNTGVNLNGTEINPSATQARGMAGEAPAATQIFAPVPTIESKPIEPYRAQVNTPEDRALKEKLMAHVDSLMSVISPITGKPFVDNVKTASEIITAIRANDLGRATAAITARGQDIGAQSHRESVEPAMAREQINAMKAHGEMAKTAEEIKKLKEAAPTVFQGYTGKEHGSWGWNPQKGKYELIASGTGPTNPEDNALWKLQHDFLVEQNKSDLKTVSGENVLATPEQKKEAQARIDATKTTLSGGKNVVGPSWEKFLAAAKKAGSKMSDAQLKQAYIERYGR